MLLWLFVRVSIFCNSLKGFFCSAGFLTFEGLRGNIAGNAALELLTGDTALHLIRYVPQDHMRCQVDTIEATSIKGLVLDAYQAIM